MPSRGTYRYRRQEIDQRQRWRGAIIIIASSSDEKLARAQALGADHLVNYRANPAWDQTVMEQTGGVGADLVLETAGVQTFARSMTAVRQGGTIFTVGFVTGTVGEIDLMPIIAKSIRVQGANTGSVSDLADAVKAVAAHRIEPVVDKIYELGDVREAYQALARGGSHFGKLAITVDFKA